MPQAKGPPFKIPKLNVTGLGLSDLVKDPEPTVPPQRPVAPEEEAKEVPQPQKKPGFSIPKLNVAGLGFSDLRPPEEPAKNLVQQPPLQQAEMETINPTAEEAVDPAVPLFMLVRESFENTIPHKPTRPAEGQSTNASAP